MTRRCDDCGTTYEAHRPTSRFCSAACQKRSRRQQLRTEQHAERAEREGLGVEAVVIAQLEKANRLNTPRGQMALAAARIIDGSTAVMGMSTLIKQLDETLEKALAGAEQVDDPVDELRAKRDQKTRGPGVTPGGRR